MPRSPTPPPAAPDGRCRNCSSCPCTCRRRARTIRPRQPAARPASRGLDRLGYQNLFAGVAAAPVGVHPVLEQGPAHSRRGSRPPKRALAAAPAHPPYWRQAEGPRSRRQGDSGSAAASSTAWLSRAAPASSASAGSAASRVVLIS